MCEARRGVGPLGARGVSFLLRVGDRAARLRWCRALVRRLLHTRRRSAYCPLRRLRWAQVTPCWSVRGVTRRHCPRTVGRSTRSGHQRPLANGRVRGMSACPRQLQWGSGSLCGHPHHHQSSIEASRALIARALLHRPPIATADAGEARVDPDWGVNRPCYRLALASSAADTVSHLPWCGPGCSCPGSLHSYRLLTVCSAVLGRLSQQDQLNRGLAVHRTV